MTKNSNSSSKTKTVTKTKKTIEGKAVARNVILVIDGKKYSKAFKIKADRENILKKVGEYNKRNSLKKEKEIIDLMLQDKTTEKDRKKEAEKAVQKPKGKLIKKESARKAKVPTKAQKIATAKKLLEEDGFIVTKKVKKTGGRSREW